MQYPCGCLNEIDPDSGVLHCVKKCEGHIEYSRAHSYDGIEHYIELGCLDKDGVPQNRKYIDEFLEAYREIGYEPWEPELEVLEVGCGVGMYVPFFLHNGCFYRAVESSEFAALWTRSNFCVNVAVCEFENFSGDEKNFDIILAAHVIEHIVDAPKALRKIFKLLYEDGMFYCIVPDDTDQTNPDHLWFFNQETLGALLEKIGFIDIRMTMRKRIERENFIYCVATKP